MDESEGQTFSKKNVISFLLVGILMLAIPFGVGLIEKQTKLTSQAAAGDAINFSGDNVSCETKNGEEKCFAADDKINIEFNYGEVGTPPLPTLPPLPDPEVTIQLPSGQRQIDVVAGKSVIFNVSATRLNPSQQKLSLYVTKVASPNNTAPENCPVGSVLGTNKEWCLITLGSSLSYPNVSWTAPSINGTYYIQANMDLVNPNAALTVFHCTGNPWCEWPGKGSCAAGSNCDTTCQSRYNWNDCGDNDFITVNVSGGLADSTGASIQLIPENQLIAGSNETTVSKGQTIAYKVISAGLNPAQQTLTVYASKDDTPPAAPANCPANQIVTYGTNRSTCRITLGDKSSYLNNSWVAPNVSGIYYLAVNMDLKDPNSALTVFHCSGNPWCEWPNETGCAAGSNCYGRCDQTYNWSKCGDNDYIKVTVN